MSVTASLRRRRLPGIALGHPFSAYACFAHCENILRPPLPATLLGFLFVLTAYLDL